MKTVKDKAGVGFDDNHNSFEAGKRAAAIAMNNMGQKNGSLVLSFCTGKHDYQACFEGIRSEVGDTPIIGGAAIGIITNDNLGYEGYQAGVAVLPQDCIFDIAAVGRLDEGETKAGLELGKQLSIKRNHQEKMILLFYDSIKSPPPPSPALNVSSSLIDGFEQGIGKNPPLMVSALIV